MSRSPVIFIIDDDEAMRQSLSEIFQSEGLNTRTFASALDFLNCYEHGCVGCILMDMRMPDSNGLEMFLKFQNSDIKLPVIFITGYGDIPTAVQAIRAGAFDFIEKPFDVEELIGRVSDCVNKSRQAVEKKPRRFGSKRVDSLTPREHQVMELMVEGKINKVIADELGISVRTVEAHRANLMDKLSAKSLSDVVRIAILETESSLE
ncbi:MAG: response regulator [Gammaproteobacteria bacterium]|jgi:FixJ family two-component response regulator